LIERPGGCPEGAAGGASIQSAPPVPGMKTSTTRGLLSVH